MTFTLYGQKDGVIVKHALSPLDRRLEEIIAPMRTRLHRISNTTRKIILARDIALYSGVFRTKKRRDELSCALIHRTFVCRMGIPMIDLLHAASSTFGLLHAASAPEAIQHLLEIHMLGR